jgi:hypothetical protein
MKEKTGLDTRCSEIALKVFEREDQQWRPISCSESVGVQLTRSSQTPNRVLNYVTCVNCQNESCTLHTAEVYLANQAVECQLFCL